MTRRNFIGGLLAAAAGFTILPGAGRVWRLQREPVFDPNDYAGRWQVCGYRINPEWVNAPFEFEFFELQMLHNTDAERYVRENGVWRHVPKFIPYE